MNYPTDEAAEKEAALIEKDCFSKAAMRSVHSDGAVSYYWSDGRHCKIKNTGKVEYV